MHDVLRAAIKIRELEVLLEGICQDDNKALEDLSAPDIVKEAKYLLGLFEREGTDLYDIRTNDISWTGVGWGMSDACKDMRRQYKALKTFLRKYATL